MYLNNLPCVFEYEATHVNVNMSCQYKMAVKTAVMLTVLKHIVICVCDLAVFHQGKNFEPFSTTVLVSVSL